jgi:glycosyltransferase involved in cell wall biosynthesis
MKILHVMPSYLPAVRYGGPIFSVHGLCRALAAQGHEVHVCTTSIDGPDDLDVPLGEPVDRDGVRVWYFRADRLRRLAASSGMRAWFAQRLGEFDLLHTHSVFLWPPWHAARRARATGVPYVMAPRGMLVSELIARRSTLAKTFWLRFLERGNLANADALHFTSELERIDAAHCGVSARRSVVIPNGIDLEQIGPGSGASEHAQSAPFVLYLGRIHWKKGLDRLLQALVRAPGIHAVIAGPDDDGNRASLERLACECGVAGRLRFLDPVHGAAKWSLLRNARVLVLPSQSENFGNAVLEAMAVGTPVLVSPGVGLARAVQDAGCGLVVEPEPGALGAALEQLWRNAPLRRAMGARGRALAERAYALPRVAGQMADLYRSILDARAGAAPRG